MNVEEVNVVVCCAEDEGLKTKLFATLGKIAGKHDKLQIAKDSEETESFLKKSVTININNKDVQVTFLDGDKDISNNSSANSMATAWHLRPCHSKCKQCQACKCHHNRAP